MWYERFYQAELGKSLQKGKVVVVYGPRRVGKTSLIERFLEDYKGRVYKGVGEDSVLRELFKAQRVEQIKNAFSGYDLLVFDEAQKLPDAGTGLKIIVDHLPGACVIASGSSSFQLSSQLGEPLTGRQRALMLFPVAMLEMAGQFGSMHVLESLEEFLVFGSYPECLTAANRDERIRYLVSLRDSYLFRDIMELENIRNADKLSDLLRLLAFQIGREVSLNELSIALALAKQTVERYLDLLEKSFIIKKVRGFSRNLRKEVSKSSRYYFLDNGIRNALVNNFNSLPFRDDVGMLWENFLFSERMKKRQYAGPAANIYFWRTYDRKEIDLVEEREGKLFGYEFKWGNKKAKPARAWLDAYANASLETVNRENFLEFVT
jgi:hypothetical protein